METFWDLGYERASTALLEQRMDIGRSSLYATFGSKDRLFAEAMDVYVADFRCRVIERLDADGPALAVLERFLLEVAERGAPGGDRLRFCMVLRASVSGPDQPKPIRERIERFVAELDDAFHRLLVRARDEGTLPGSTQLRETARYLTTIFQSLNVAAHAGRSRRELREIVRRALRSLD